MVPAVASFVLPLLAPVPQPDLETCAAFALLVIDAVPASTFDRRPPNRWQPSSDSSQYRVVAFDTRGAGRTTQVDEPVTTTDLANDTIGLMQELGLTKAHIVVRSMGVAIAQIVAIQRPDFVRSLALCASFAELAPLGVRVLTNMRHPRVARKLGRSRPSFRS